MNFNQGAVHLCNGNYTDESSRGRGTNGSGYIYARNGNVERKGSGAFSGGIAWWGSGSSGLPTGRSSAGARPPGGCYDTTFYRRFFTNRVFYTYQFVNSDSEPVQVELEDTLPAGFIWDPSYAPKVNGALGMRDADGQLKPVVLQFNNGNTSLSFSGIEAPVGISSITVGTTESAVKGTVRNDVTLKAKRKKRSRNRDGGDTNTNNGGDNNTNNGGDNNTNNGGDNNTNNGGDNNTNNGGDNNTNDDDGYDETSIIEFIRTAFLNLF